MEVQFCHRRKQNPALFNQYVNKKSLLWHLKTEMCVIFMTFYEIKIQKMTQWVNYEINREKFEITRQKSHN